MRRFLIAFAFGIPLAALGHLSGDASDASQASSLSTLSSELAKGTPSSVGLLASASLDSPPPTELIPAASEQAPADSSTNNQEDQAPIPDAGVTDLEGKRILAFYGKPGAKSMGILGEYPKEQVASLLLGYSRLYADAASASESPGVVPAFYIIYGACWPGGDIGYLNDRVVKDWIAYANREGFVVFLDHQIGRFGVDEAMNRLLPWLVYPNVHLALDPEWRTTDPMKTIGSVSAAELNKAQSMMVDWMSSHQVQGERMLVVHQFAAKMIIARDQVRSDYPGVRLVHTADGFGSPSLKRSTYAWNATATNMPTKGFKLFFKSKVPGAGFDDPLLTPLEVLSLKPSPELIIYQ